MTSYRARSASLCRGRLKVQTLTPLHDGCSSLTSLDIRKMPVTYEELQEQTGDIPFTASARRILRCRRTTCLSMCAD